MAKKKQDKFEKQEEQLQEVNNALTGAGQWIEKHSKALSWGVTIIVLIVLGIMLYQQYVIAPRHRAATEENYENYQALVSGNVAEAAEGFAATADKYDVQEGKLAAVFAGTSYFHMGQYQDAIDYLEKFSSEDPHVNAAAKLLIGDAYVELGQYEDAINAYEAATATGHEVFAPISLKKAGFAYLKLNDKKGAHEAFAAVKANYPASIEAQDIDKYIELTK